MRDLHFHITVQPREGKKALLCFLLHMISKKRRRKSLLLLCQKVAVSSPPPPAKIMGAFCEVMSLPKGLKVRKV